METFVLQHGVLRWGVLTGVVITAVSVTVRLSRPARVADYAARQSNPVVDRDSDAAHLVMCLLMAVMLLFPVRAAPEAVHGVLTAMTVVYGILLGTRILNWRNGVASGHAVTAFGYHLAAAAAMLLAMSGMHRTAGTPMPAMTAAMAGPHAPLAPPFVLLTLATAFALDATLLVLPLSADLRRRLIPHGPAGSGPVVPHVMMDLGTAYMLVAAALG